MKHREIKILFIGLLLGLLLPGFCLPGLAVSVDDFSDINSSQWHYEYVCRVVAEGLYNGVSEDSFAPEQSMTRAMFITVLGRFAGVDPDAWCTGSVNADEVNLRAQADMSGSVLNTLSKGTAVQILGENGQWLEVEAAGKTGYVFSEYISPDHHRFEDVSFGKYYTGYAIWAFEKGYISGSGSASTFAPGDKITREQICKILNSYASVNQIELPEVSETLEFEDRDAISSWALEAVQNLQKSGIVNGISHSDGTYSFEPGRSATRAEVAKLICCFMDVIEAGQGGAGDAPSVEEEIDDEPLPVPISDEKVSLPVERIRVGLYMSTETKDSQAETVTLKNVGGEGFEYGYIDAKRCFVSEGELSASELTIDTDGAVFYIRSAGGDVLLERSKTFALRPAGDGKPLTSVDDGERYYGEFEFRHAWNEPGYITLINVVDVEEYIMGVLPYEFSPSWPLETLRAAAIVCRSFTMNYCSGSVYIDDYGFDVPANDGTQTYKGRGQDESESFFVNTDTAVKDTENMYLCYNAAICRCTYFSSDGGATESCKNIWGGDLPYLTGKPDPYEEAAAGEISAYTYSNTRSRSGSSLKELAADLGLDTIAPEGIEIECYEETGNVKAVVIRDVDGDTAVIDQNSSVGRLDFLSAFGFTWYSYRYSVSYDAASDSFTATRYGWGHNVGMSQWGAYAMAKYYALDYRQILGFYYSDTKICYGE